MKTILHLDEKAIKSLNGFGCNVDLQTVKEFNTKKEAIAFIEPLISVYGFYTRLKPKSLKGNLGAGKFEIYPSNQKIQLKYF